MHQFLTSTTNLLIGGMGLIIIGVLISFNGSKLGFFLGAVIASGGILTLGTVLGMEFFSK